MINQLLDLLVGDGEQTRWIDGRLTGPHLHYETRVDDETVDQQKFLKADTTLFGT